MASAERSTFISDVCMEVNVPHICHPEPLAVPGETSIINTAILPLVLLCFLYLEEK